MWCERCCQEVPGIARAGNRQLIVCPRCEHSLLQTLPPQGKASPKTPDSLQTPDPAAPFSQPSTPADAVRDEDSTAADRDASLWREQISPPAAAPGSEAMGPIFEDDSVAPQLDEIWEEAAWAAVNRDADRLLQRFDSPHRQPRVPPHRYDAAHSTPEPHTHWPPFTARGDESAARAFDSAKVAVFLGAAGLLLGGSAVVFGESSDMVLWRISGMVAAAVSQMIFLAGVVGVVMALWRMHRVTQERLARLDRDIDQLQNQARRNTSRREPQADKPVDTLLLVDNMRRQLDRLAQRVRDERDVA